MLTYISFLIDSIGAIKQQLFLIHLRSSIWQLYLHDLQVEIADRDWHQDQTDCNSCKHLDVESPLPGRNRMVADDLRGR